MLMELLGLVNKVSGFGELALAGSMTRGVRCLQAP